jgi:tryptophan synthase alpha subunit
MLKLAEQIGMIEPGALLPTGVIVGSAVIEKVTENDDLLNGI